MKELMDSTKADMQTNAAVPTKADMRTNAAVPTKAVQIKKPRESNFELLRIISMIIIVSSHYGYHGMLKASSYGDMFQFNALLMGCLEFGGKLGVNLFILISGYFLVEAAFSIKKFIRLVFDCFFYSWVFNLIFVIFGGVKLNVTDIFRSFFPIEYGVWWFVTTYAALYLLSAWINPFIMSIKIKQLDSLIIVLVVICSLLPTLLMKSGIAGSNLIWFVTLYLVAARIRLFPFHFKGEKFSIFIGVGIYAFCLLTVILYLLYPIQIPIAGYSLQYFGTMQSFTMFSCALFLFIGFKNIKIKPSKFINAIGGSTFCVYLVHEHPLVRKFLWKGIFSNKAYQFSPYLLLHAIVSIAITFIACAIIGYVYNRTIGRLFNNLFEKVAKHFKNKPEIVNPNANKA